MASANSSKNAKKAEAPVEEVAPAATGRRLFGRAAEPAAAPLPERNERETFELRQRVRVLEAEIKSLRGRPFDLAEFDDNDLAVMASEASVRILKVARTEAKNATEQAQKLRAEAERESSQLVRNAEAKAAELVASATAAADKIRADIEKESARLQKAAQTTANQTISAAEAQATELVTTATTAAEKLRVEAQKEANRITKAAQTEATQTAQAAATAAEELTKRTTAEMQAALTEASREAASIREAAETESKAKVAKATAEARDMIRGAQARKQELMTALEEQKRFLQVTLADASAIQSAFTQGYALLRKTIDTSVEHLIEPVRQARNQIERIDFELSQKDEK